MSEEEQPPRNPFRFVPIAALIAFIGVFVYALRVDEANLVKLRSPVPLGAEAGKAMPDAEGAKSSRLAIQHLSGREVANLLNQIVAEGFTFNATTYAANVAAMEKYFTPGGYAAYKEFLNSSSIENTLSSQNLQAGAFIEEQPLELNRGVFDGTFKWVFEVPVTISFLPRSETIDAQTASQNRRILLRVQFARVEDAANPDAIKIEIWQVLPPRRN